MSKKVADWADMPVSWSPVQALKQSFSGKRPNHVAGFTVSCQIFGKNWNNFMDWHTRCFSFISCAKDLKRQTTVGTLKKEQRGHKASFSLVVTRLPWGKPGSFFSCVKSNHIKKPDASHRAYGSRNILHRNDLNSQADVVALHPGQHAVHHEHEQEEVEPAPEGG